MNTVEKILLVLTSLVVLALSVAATHEGWDTMSKDTQTYMLGVIAFAMITFAMVIFNTKRGDF